MYGSAAVTSVNRFDHPEFGKVRVVMQSDGPWFYGTTSPRLWATCDLTRPSARTA